MKISKFVQTAKNTGQCIVIHAAGEIYLSNGNAIYKASELPNMNGKSQIAAVLDIEPKKLKKITIMETSYTSRDDICGYDLSDGTTVGEMEIEKMETAAVVNGNIYAAFRCNNGEITFFSEDLLAPIKDRIKDESTYTSYAARTHAKGFKYIIIKDGFEVLAAILPVKILNEDYMDNLRIFYDKCCSQYNLEQMREHAELEEMNIPEAEAENNE